MPSASASAASAHAIGEVLAGAGEEDAAIGQRRGEALAFEAGDVFYRGRVSDAEALGDIGGAGLAAGGEQVGDQLDILFEQGDRAGGTGLAETPRLRWLFGHFR